MVAKRKASVYDDESIQARGNVTTQRNPGKGLHFTGAKGVKRV